MRETECIKRKLTTEEEQVTWVHTGVGATHCVWSLDGQINEKVMISQLIN